MEINHDYVLSQLWNGENSLEVIDYSPVILQFPLLIRYQFRTNESLHSLRIVLNNFADIFTLLPFTPNLTCLNLQTYPPIQFNTNAGGLKLKLKEFHLKFYNEPGRVICFDRLLDVINQISSTLVCLSLNLSESFLDSGTDSVPFDHLKLKQYMETMNKLSEFHLYAKLQPNQTKQNQRILLDLKKQQLLSDRNVFFGVYNNYFYTLPFYFDYLHEIDSNIHENLKDPGESWHNVRYVHLNFTLHYDEHIISVLKSKMPKLMVILWRKESQSNRTYEEIRNIMANYIRIFHSNRQDFSSDSKKDWYAFRLNTPLHLYLQNEEVTLAIKKAMTQCSCVTHNGLVRLSKINRFHLSSFSHVDFSVDRHGASLEWYADILTKIVQTFQHLETIKVFVDDQSSANELIENLHMNRGSFRNFVLKRYSESFLLKKIN
ncbi:unnamed protein product [Adineta ricciae]|uniref:Uncharacterized protein n=1 Tax=Adineta ricciae TaxID=249248 RepID=A0A814KLT0_ADIRI|nr:unnamed protein product [Adineta ricciae]